MALTQTAPGATHVPGISWSPVAAGLWVARRGDEFAGMSEERWGVGFHVTDRLGRDVGDYPTLAEARGALG
ncbi:hypothetical protein [Clavibacter zhangzhiyongii]|uniref:Uncharacterized protein n=1 Tax=Clavibacter zhangzhiyongii TaxID=2768071 RepID=A0A7L7Z3K9_9MICO|nr:hypothetical protein [Clavibacter zhangzhiyongii]MBM7026708.1 hypothetical protein [Clavibacter zhangzhiyongii]QOD44239.1 hypothetical protein H9X71_02495 [Clavibacter zhangzhiyongii]